HRIDQCSACRLAWIAQAIPAALVDTLAVFQCAELTSRIDADIRVRPDAEPPTCTAVGGRRTNSVAQVGLRQGAERYHGAAVRQPPDLITRNMSCMHDAPAWTDLHLVEQPFNGTTT